MDNKEIEVRFLEINKAELIEKLNSLGAQDLGDDLYHEVIFAAFDKGPDWLPDGKKFIRLRKTKSKILLTYKYHHTLSAEGTDEVELAVDDFNKAKALIEAVGIPAFREQEKKCHNFKLGDVIVGIDTWPGIPTYVELEGPSEQHLKDVAKKLDLDWSKAIYENAKVVIQKYYNIPVATFHIYRFDKME